jgi:hypothetical protein
MIASLATTFTAAAIVVAVDVLAHRVPSGMAAATLAVMGVATTATACEGWSLLLLRLPDGIRVVGGSCEMALILTFHRGSSERQTG